MIEERAVILSLESNSSPADTSSIATLEIERKTACGLCGQTRGCGNAIWGKLFAHRSTAFKANNSIHASVGQSVIVGINERALLWGALLLYILPLVTMLIASILIMQWTDSNGITMLAALIGLVLGLLWVKGFTAMHQYFVLQQPVILRLADDDRPITFANQLN
ncbi:SoxR reducing system RseC family protein [Methylotenera sp. 1P/1]|uniref:SoxR reducing system RseC family protein n=1 Tax=Methylotenera sp. 1P/1 TaxID=1131551 RepID=UPI00035FADF0|nr:SoxR reducing system RseC family protein [Methylotenera sp. 1P/1]